MPDWLLGTSGGDAVRVAASGLLIYVLVIVVNRINGLRTFAKMSGYDFAATVAIGSILASTTLTGSTPVSSGLIAVATVVAAQRAFTMLRRRSPLKAWIDNEPMLLAHDGRALEDNLRRSGIAPDDLREKIRSAGAHGLHDVAAVVLETSGDVSVILGDASELDVDLFVGVRGNERL